MRKQRECVKCGKLHRNQKYCSRQCSGTGNINNNHLVIYNKNRVLKTRCCKYCGIEIGKGWDGSIVCKNCNPNIVDWTKVKLSEFREGRPNYQVHSRLRQIARMMYKKTNKPQLCNKCGYNKFYEICHIKPLSKFNESDTIAIINSLDNLIALCPNCHWEFDNGLFTI